MKHCRIRFGYRVDVNQQWLMRESGAMPGDPLWNDLPHVDSVIVYGDGSIEFTTDDWDELMPRRTEPYWLIDATDSEMVWLDVTVAKAMGDSCRVHVNVDSPMGKIVFVNRYAHSATQLAIEAGDGQSMQDFDELTYGPWVSDLLLALLEGKMVEDTKRIRMRLVDAAKLADFLRTDKAAIEQRNEAGSMQKYCDWINANWSVCPVAVGTLQDLCDEFGVKIGPAPSDAVDKEARAAVVELKGIMLQMIELLHDKGNDAIDLAVNLANVPAL